MNIRKCVTEAPWPLSKAGGMSGVVVVEKAAAAVVLSGRRSGKTKNVIIQKSFCKPISAVCFKAALDQNRNHNPRSIIIVRGRSSPPTNTAELVAAIQVESEDEVKSECTTTSSTTSEDVDPLADVGVGDTGGSTSTTTSPSKKKRRSARYDSSESSDRVMTTSFSSGISSFDESDSVSNFSIKSDVSESGISIKSTSSFTDSTTSSQNSCSSSSTSSSKTCTSSSSANKLFGGSSLVKCTEAEPVVTDGSRCLWKDCRTELNGNLSVVEHIQIAHVVPQVTEGDGESYTCLWEGCKVFSKKSCSLSWLERHVLSHGGNKPLKCIFPGCGLAFSSQNALERHVNSHISNPGCIGGANGHGPLSSRKFESSPSKLTAARRKKLKALRRQRQQPWGQKPDFFDMGIMEKIRFRLLTGETGQLSSSKTDCVFKGEVEGRRCAANGEPQLLVKWTPPDILPTEWIPQSKYKETKIVPIHQLPPNKLYPKLPPPPPKVKASRKKRKTSFDSPTS